MDVQSSLVAHPSTSFHCSAKDVALVQQTVITLENDKVNMRTLQVSEALDNILTVFH